MNKIKVRAKERWEYHHFHHLKLCQSIYIYIYAVVPRNLDPDLLEAGSYSLMVCAVTTKTLGSPLYA